MKKTIIIATCLVIACVHLDSCQSSSVCVGDLKNDDPVVCVKTIHHNFFVDGLLGRKRVKANDYTQGLESYKIRNYRTFVDCVIGGVTCGIYTPSTTEIYLPANPASKQTISE